MPNTTESIVQDSNDIPGAGFFDPVSHQLVAAEVVSVQRDAVTGKLYGILNVSASGNFNNASVGTDNSTAPSSSTQIGGQDGSGKLQPLNVDASGNLKVSGGSTQYTDGSAAPTHPIGNEIVFNNNGTMTSVSNSNPLPTYAPTNYALESNGNLATLLARLTDTFGNNTAITAATTFGSIPLISALAVSSYATFSNASYQDTFIVQINVASAFVGTIGFYGLLPDGATLQAINAHQRATATNGNSTAINTSSALEQTWEGSIAGFKAIYVVCTVFTSGAASVQIGLTAANYAHAIINTVSQNLTQLNGTTPQLDGVSLNRLGVSLYGKNSAAGDTSLAVDSSGRLQDNIAQIGGNTVVTAGVNGLQAVGGNAASGASDTGNPVKVGGVYNSSPPTLTTGQRSDLQMDSSGNAKFYLATQLDKTNDSITNYPYGHQYQNITTDATTIVKSGSGVLHRIVINTPVASSVITLYDNTTNSGSKIGTITLPATLLSQGPMVAQYELAFTTGLTIVTGTGASDITVVYR
jgi:hypothetical protein